MGRLFGTDGVRGIANKDLTNELALSIGKAAAKVLAGELGRKPTVLIGKDTRASGGTYCRALRRGGECALRGRSAYPGSSLLDRPLRL